MDKFEDVKNKLKQYRNCEDELGLLKLQIEELEHRITTVNSTSVIGKPDNGGEPMYLKDYVNKLEDLKNEYVRRYMEAFDKMLDVKDYINQLDNMLERRLLFRYYCSEKKVSLTKISRELSYSPDHIKRVHSHALRHLRELGDREWQVRKKNRITKV